MGMMNDPYADPDFILALYQDPANEVLLAEYALSTGGIQLGVTSAGGSAGGGVAGTDNVVRIVVGSGSHGCFLSATPIRMANRNVMRIRDVMPDFLVTAFDANGKLHRGRVLTHTIQGATEYMQLVLADGRKTKTVGVHPYWQGGDRFVEIAEVESHVLSHVRGRWREIKILDRKIIHKDFPFLKHDLEIETWNTFIANDDGVHNKPPAPGDPP